MKLASYRDGSRDGHLVVVSRDLSLAHYCNGIASHLRQVLDDWAFLAPQLQEVYETLNHGKARHAFAFDPQQCLAPLPRAARWSSVVVPSDGPKDWGLHHAPSDEFGSSHEALPCWGEAAPEVVVQMAALMGDVHQGEGAQEALASTRLLSLSVTAAPGSEPSWSAFSAVAVTPDELAPAWAGGRVALPIKRRINGRAAGELSCGKAPGDHLGAVLARLSRYRAVRAGSLVATAPWQASVSAGLSVGDSLQLDMAGVDGLSVFGSMALSLVPRG